jgi:AcrR family transcriptional regulator
MGTAAATPFARAQQTGQQALRRALLDAAGRLLAEAGPQALTMRRIAAEVGCSTTVLYTMFSSKEGIAQALYTEGFERFRRRLERVPDDGSALDRLGAMGDAYRENALAERNYYGVMFGQPIPGFTPSAESIEAARTTLSMLTAQVERCMDAGVLRRQNPWAVAEVLWAAAHGAVSLELAGHFGDEASADQCFTTLLVGAAMPFLQQQSGGKS